MKPPLRPRFRGPAADNESSLTQVSSATVSKNAIRDVAAKKVSYIWNYPDSLTRAHVRLSQPALGASGLRILTNASSLLEIFPLVAACARIELKGTFTAIDNFVGRRTKDVGSQNILRPEARWRRAISVPGYVLAQAASLATLSIKYLVFVTATALLCIRIIISMLRYGPKQAMFQWAGRFGAPLVTSLSPAEVSAILGRLLQKSASYLASPSAKPLLEGDVNAIATWAASLGLRPQDEEGLISGVRAESSGSPWLRLAIGALRTLADIGVIDASSRSMQANLSALPQITAAVGRVAQDPALQAVVASGFSVSSKLTAAIAGLVDATVEANGHATQSSQSDALPKPLEAVNDKSDANYSAGLTELLSQGKQYLTQSGGAGFRNVFQELMQKWASAGDDDATRASNLFDNLMDEVKSVNWSQIGQDFMGAIESAQQDPTLAETFVTHLEILGDVASFLAGMTKAVDPTLTEGLFRALGKLDLSELPNVLSSIDTLALRESLAEISRSLGQVDDQTEISTPLFDFVQGVLRAGKHWVDHVEPGIKDRAQQAWDQTKQGFAEAAHAAVATEAAHISLKKLADEMSANETAKRWSDLAHDLMNGLGRFELGAWAETHWGPALSHSLIGNVTLKAVAKDNDSAPAESPLIPNPIRQLTSEWRPDARRLIAADLNSFDKGRLKPNEEASGRDRYKLDGGQIYAPFLAKTPLYQSLRDETVSFRHRPGFHIWHEKRRSGKLRMREAVRAEIKLQTTRVHNTKVFAKREILKQARPGIFFDAAIPKLVLREHASVSEMASSFFHTTRKADSTQEGIVRSIREFIYFSEKDRPRREGDYYNLDWETKHFTKTMSEAFYAQRIGQQSASSTIISNEVETFPQYDGNYLRCPNDYLYVGWQHYSERWFKRYNAPSLILFATIPAGINSFYDVARAFENKHPFGRALGIIMTDKEEKLFDPDKRLLAVKNADDLRGKLAQFLDDGLSHLDVMFTGPQPQTDAASQWED